MNSKIFVRMRGKRGHKLKWGNPDQGLFYWWSVWW